MGRALKTIWLKGDGNYEYLDSVLKAGLITYASTCGAWPGVLFLCFESLNMPDAMQTNQSDRRISVRARTDQTPHTPEI
jgi:hypothetical protein